VRVNEEEMMYHLRVSWRTFLKLLPVWEGMSMEGRKLFLEKKANLNVDPALFGDYLPELLHTGLVELSPKKQWVKLTSQTALFHRTMVGMTMSKVHANPDKYAVMRYLNNHYPPIELEKLLHYRSHHEKENAFRKITAVSWLECFLIEKDYHAWEELHGDDPIWNPLITSQEIFETMKRIIRLLMTCPEAIPFSSLPRGEKAADDEVLADALGACIRYALLFPELRPVDLIPVIGIWPAISQHLHRPKPKAPQPGEATECFFLPFLMEDITSLLVACSGNPLRLQAHGDMLYRRDSDALASSLVSLPLWVLAATNWNPPARVDMAAYWLSTLGLVETDSLPGTKRRMATTASGQQWLTFSPKERLSVVLNAGKRRMGLKGGFLAEVEGTRALDPLVEFFRDGIEHRRRPIIMALRRIFEPLSGGAMLPLQDFTAYHAHETNPLIRSLDPQEPILKIRSWSTWSTPPPDDDQKEDLWAKALYRWVLYCLLPQGAVQLGMYGPNHSICFSLTEIGRYFLGFVEDFDFGAAEEGNVIVQPNFDVVFLAPSPFIEAEIAPFAERKGAKMGLLFRITKSSIFKAAALGLTSGKVLETLNRVSSKEIPANVVREIEGWYGQCRRVAMRQVLMVTCRDPETAVRVLAAAKPDSERVTDTIVAFRDLKGQAALIRKLSTMGIFIDKPVSGAKKGKSIPDSEREFDDNDGEDPAFHPHLERGDDVLFREAEFEEDQ